MCRTIFTTLWPLWNLKVFGTELAVLAETLSYALSFACNHQSNISLYSGKEPLTSALHDCDLSMLAKCTTSAVSVSIKHFLLEQMGKQWWNIWWDKRIKTTRGSIFATKSKFLLFTWSHPANLSNLSDLGLLPEENSDFCWRRPLIAHTLKTKTDLIVMPPPHYASGLGMLGQFCTRQFGTRIIWHQDSKQDNKIDNLAQDKSI